MTEFQVNLKNGTSRTIEAADLRSAQDMAYARWPLYQVIFVREKRTDEEGVVTDGRSR